MRAFCVVALLLAAVLAPTPAAAQVGEQCFPETGFCIGGPFRRYWEANGGLPVFGFPITAARPERNRDTGETYLTQWFERNRFELHSDQVLLGRLGDDRLRQLGIDWRTQPKGAPVEGCDFYTETEHLVCDQATGLGFKTYWTTRGGLDFFGFPLTEARMETNASGDRVLTQWFERARFEWHPGNADEFKVLLGLLGREVGPPAGQPVVPPVAPAPPGTPESPCPSLAVPTGAGVRVAAAVSDPSPPQQSQVTVCGLVMRDGQPLAQTAMAVVWNFAASTPVCEGVSNEAGVATCTRPIGAAPIGQEVLIEVNFQVDGRWYDATTSFTPR
jgi:hypothetical protein